MSNSILLIYTGGTIGMVQDVKTGALIPFNFEHLTKQVPELEKFNLTLHSFSFQPPIDSSDMQPEIWTQLVNIIEEKYLQYDGFVVLHGSDTMAYTASALSFMLKGLNKPVILTGSQLPIGIIRTDGKENLITAIEIAAAKNKNGLAMVPEVAIYFEYKLYRGNRTHKYNAEHFDAFNSPNYPLLAEAGVHIQYHTQYINAEYNNTFLPQKNLSDKVASIKLFPGISENFISAIFNNTNAQGIVLETFGSGNGPTQKWFLNALENAIKNDVIIYNVTQCNRGAVLQGKYETSKALGEIGVLSGNDITFEAAITKLMFLLAQPISHSEVKNQLQKSICGELTLV